MTTVKRKHRVPRRLARQQGKFHPDSQFVDSATREFAQSGGVIDRLPIQNVSPYAVEIAWELWDL